MENNFNTESKECINYYQDVNECLLKHKYSDFNKKIRNCEEYW